MGTISTGTLTSGIFMIHMVFFGATLCHNLRHLLTATLSKLSQIKQLDEMY
jgi:hypothetical protein